MAETETFAMSASFGKRFLALILDGLILLIPCAIGAHLVPVIGGLAVWFFYAPILESSAIRATLGKHLMGIQVVDLSGRRISLRAALIRNLLKVVSTAILFVGFLVALFTEKKQALHDLLADTWVVDGKNEMSVVDAWTDHVKDVFHSTAPRSGKSDLSSLERLQRLRESGALTEEEFADQKRKILAGEG